MWASDVMPALKSLTRAIFATTKLLGARDGYIHWAQEMYDQAGMLRELVKWDYELRDARQVDQVVAA